MWSSQQTRLARIPGECDTGKFRTRGISRALHPFHCSSSAMRAGAALMSCQRSSRELPARSKRAYDYRLGLCVCTVQCLLTPAAYFACISERVMKNCCCGSFLRRPFCLDYCFRRTREHEGRDAANGFVFAGVRRIGPRPWYPP